MSCKSLIAIFLSLFLLGGKTSLSFGKNQPLQDNESLAQDLKTHKVSQNSPQAHGAKSLPSQVSKGEGVKVAGESLVEEDSEKNEDSSEEDTYKDRHQHLDDDPFEAINRKVFAFNEVVDGVLLDPLANMYRMGVPEDVQTGIANALHNASEPLIFVNDCLQRKKNQALASFSRFLINTVFGIFGIFDVAKYLGLEAHKESFNTTLKSWNVPQGPYIILPVLGPANPRYIIGKVGDYFMDPLNYYGRMEDKESWLYWRTGLYYITARASITEDIKNFRENSIDFYAAMRSFYKQYMDADRMDGKVHYKSPSLDEFMLDDDEDEEEEKRS